MTNGARARAHARGDAAVDGGDGLGGAERMTNGGGSALVDLRVTQSRVTMTAPLIEAVGGLREKGVLVFADPSFRRSGPQKEREGERCALSRTGGPTQPNPPESNNTPSVGRSVERSIDRSSGSRPTGVI